MNTSIIRTALAFFIHLIRKSHHFFEMAYAWGLFKYEHVTYQNYPNIQGFMFIKNYGSISLGRSVCINSSIRSNPIGHWGKCTFFVGKHGHLCIGDLAGISNSAICCNSKIHIGSKVFIGGGCRIYDTDFHSLHLNSRLQLDNDTDIVSLPVVIDDGAFIGAGSIILKGVVIGKEAVIGAGSVVTKSVPAKEIWAGNPARFIKKL